MSNPAVLTAGARLAHYPAQPGTDESRDDSGDSEHPSGAGRKSSHELAHTGNTHVTPAVPTHDSRWNSRPGDKVTAGHPLPGTSFSMVSAPLQLPWKMTSAARAPVMPPQSECRPQWCRRPSSGRRWPCFYSLLHCCLSCRVVGVHLRTTTSRAAILPDGFRYRRVATRLTRVLDKARMG